MDEMGEEVQRSCGRWLAISDAAFGALQHF